MKRYLGFGGVLIVLISVLISMRKLNELKTLKFGSKVEVTVMRVPISCEESNKNLKAYFTFEYNNKNHSKRLSGKYCTLIKRNSKLELITNTNNSIFLYTDEDVKSELLIGLVLLIFGFYFIYRGFLK